MTDEKNQTELEIPTKLTENFIEVYLIRSLCLIKILPSYVYVNSLNKRSAILILDSIFNHIPPIKCRCEFFEMQRDWFLHCFRKLIEPQEETNFDFLKFYRVLFSHANKPYSKNIVNFLNRKMISNTEEFHSEQDEVNLFSSFFSVYSDNPALFYSIRYFKIKDKFIFPTNFQFSGSEGRLIANFGNRLFECCSTIPPILLRASKWEDLIDLYGLPSIFSSENGIKAAQQVQLAFFTVHKFPRLSFFGDNENYLLSLMNTSLLFNNHFFDLIFKPSLEFLSNAEYQKFLSLYNDYLIDAFDIPMLAIYDKGKSKDLEYFTRIILIHFENKQNDLNTPFKNLLNEIFEMLRDDILLVQEAKDLTGNVISIDLLSRQSFPYLFYSFLESENEEPFQKMRQKHPFSYSPTDWANDNDFVSSYFSLLYSIQLIKEGNEEIYDQIAFYLSQIKNKEIVNSVSIDIFSLLFLKSPDGKFFIPKERGETLLRVLIDTDNEDDRVHELYNHLRHGIRKLQFASILFPDITTIEGIMHSNEEIFLCALNQKETAILGSIAYEKNSNDFCTPKKAKLAKQIIAFSESYANGTQYNSKLMNETKVEIICSFKLTKDELNSLADKLPLNEDTKIIINRRLNFQHFALFDPKSFEIPIDINEKLTEKSFKGSTWEVTSFNSFEGRFRSFIHYLDTIIPPLLISEPDSTVFDCLQMDSKSSLISLINDGQFEQTDNLAKSIGCNPVEILLNCDECSDNSLEFIARESLVIAACQALQHNKTTIKYFNNSRPLKMFHESKENELAELSKSEIIQKSIQIIKNKPIQIEQLSDLWFRLTEQDISEFLITLLPEFDEDQLHDLVEVTELNGLIKLNEIIKVIYSSTKLLKQSAYPLDKTFSLLLEKSTDCSLSICCSMYKLFRNQLDFDILLNKCLNQNPQLIPKIRKIDSKIKSGITKIFPTESNITELIIENDENENEIFFNSIPSNWTVDETPEKTIIENIEDVDTISNLLHRFHSINIDDMILMKIMEITIDATKTISDRAIQISIEIRRFLKLMRNPFELIVLVFQQLIVLISQINIADEESELMAFETLLIIKKSMRILIEEVDSCQIQKSTLIQHQTLTFPNQLNGKESSTVDEVYNHINECINLAIKFVSYYNWTKFHIEYSFVNFIKPQFGSYLIQLCYNFDSLELIEEIASVWDLSSYSNEQDEYALKILQLGIDNNPQDPNNVDHLYENGFIISRIAADRRKVHSDDDHLYVQKFISAYRHRLFYDPEICARLQDITEIDSIIENEFTCKEDEVNEPETKILSIKSLFRSASAEENLQDSKVKHFYSRIEQLTKVTEEEKLSIEEAYKIALEKQGGSESFEQLDPLLIFDFPSIDMSEILLPGTPALLSRYLATRTPFYEAARYFGYVGEFEASLSVIESSQSVNDNWTIFFNDIILPAIERGRIGQLFIVIQRALKAEQEEHVTYSISFKKMMEKLLEISTEIPYTKLAVTIALGLLDQAAKSAIDIFKNAQTSKERIIALDIAFALSVSYLQKNQEQDNCQSIISLVKLIPLQKQFCQLFDANCNIFDSQASVESMVVFLILHCQFLLATQISLESSIDIKHLSDLIADIFVNESDETVSKIIEGFENNAPLFMFKQFILSVSHRIAYMHFDERLLFVVIESVQSKTIKAYLYLHYGSLEDAFSCAKEADADVLPLIGHMASREGKLQMVQEIVRLIEKNMKNS